MSVSYGVNWKINRVVTGTPDTYYEIGGTVLNAKVDPRPKMAEEVGSGEGRQLASQKVVSILPIIEWEMNVRRFEDYLIPYGIRMTTESVPEHTIYITDGNEHWKAIGKVDKVRIKIDQNTGSIRASVTFLCKTLTQLGSVGTFVYRTEQSIGKTDVITFLIGGVSQTKWADIEMLFDNNVLQETLGTGLPPAEVQEQESRYEFHVRKAKTSSLYNYTYTGASIAVVLSIRDHQAAPLTTLFTYNTSYIETDEVNDRELGIVYERVIFKAAALSRSQS